MNDIYNSNRNSQYSDPNVKVALAQQGAEMIVKIECHFIHLVCVSIHWKHTPATVSDLHVDSTPTRKSHNIGLSVFGHSHSRLSSQ